MLANHTKKADNDILLAFVEILPILIPYFVGFFVYRGFYSNFPIYLQLQGLSEQTVVEYWTVISTTALFMGGITRIPAGMLSDRLGRIRAIFLGYTLYIMAISLLIFYSGLLVYVVSVSLIRMTLNLYAMSGRGIASVSKREKGFKNGLLSSMVGTGSLFGPIVLSYTLDNYQPSAMLTVTLAFIAVDAVIFLLALRIIPHLFSRITDKEMELPLYPLKKENVEVAKYFRNKDVIKSISLFFSSGVVYGLITVIFTIYGYNVLNIDIVTLGLIVGVGAIANIIVAPITGLLYMRFLDEHIRITAWTGVTIATLMSSLGNLSIVLFVAGYVLLGFSNAMFFTMEITRLGRIVEKEAFSVIFGTSTMLVILGSALSSSLTKFLYNISPEATFITAFILATITLLFVIFTRQRTHVELE